MSERRAETKQPALRARLILLISGLSFLVLRTARSMDYIKHGAVLAVLLVFAVFWLPITEAKLRERFRLSFCAAAVVVCTVYADRFYRSWHAFRLVRAVIGGRGLDTDAVWLIFTIVLMALSVPALTFVAGCAAHWFARHPISERMAAKNKTLTDKNAFIVICAVYAVALYPLIRGGFLHNDDLGRVNEGYDGWHDYSRYISNFLSHFLHADAYLTDIAPITQLLAIAIMAFSSVLLIRQVKKTERVSPLDIAAVIPLGLSPYFLECFSFKFDAPYMALSVLFSIAPTAFRERPTKIYAAAAAAGALAMCMTYQASSGIFPMLVVMLAFLMWCRGEDNRKTLRFIGVSAAAYSAGLAFFALAFRLFGGASGDVGSTASFLANYRTFLRLVADDFKLAWLFLAAVLALGFAAAAVTNSRRNRLKTALLAACVLCVMFLLSFGAYPFLAICQFNPRTMYGVGCCIAFWGIGTMAQSRDGRLAAGIIAAALSWAFIAFACTYGNARTVQDKYIDFRISEVMDDLADIEEIYSGEYSTIYVSGSAGYSPAIEHMPGDYGMLKRLIPVQFAPNYWWNTYKFANYYWLKNVTYEYAPEEYRSWDIRQESYYHVIYQNGGLFVVELKQFTE